jgi:nucleoside-diphosphate-sugar epimerase
MAKRVLVTGHRGYIGSVMAPFLIDAGYEVRGLDTDYYGGNNFVPDLSQVAGIVKDIRDLVSADLEGFDAVIHLAALSNDPIGNLNEGWTTEINHRASVKLATLAREAGVPRFLFSSSCIMYGSSDLAVVDETCALDPKTEYAASKVESERAISGLARAGFSPTFLRNGTVYGVSPRMRFDTVFNNLMGSAVTTGKVVLFSNGTPWRPVVHIEDIARSFMAVLEAPLDVVHNQAFNNGADFLNRQIIDLARIVVATVPGSTLEVRAASDADQRTYRADFTKFARAFPDFQFKWSAETGARDLFERFTSAGLSQEQFAGKAFTRLKWLRHLLDAGRLDSNLRWTPSGVTA